MAQYALLVYDTEAAWDAVTEEQRETATAAYDAFERRHRSVIRSGAEFAPAASANTLRGSHADGLGEVRVTTGTFPEESPFDSAVLGGFYVIEVDTLEQALALARQLPVLEGGVEVRPVIERAEGIG